MMKKIDIPTIEILEIVSLYEIGMGISEISNKMKYSRAKIREILKENNVYKKNGNYGIKYNWSHENIADVIHLYESENMSADAIGEIYGCHDTTILNLLTKNGVDTSRKRECHNFRKYDVNIDYFKIIDTEEKAYWFGFLLADGHVSINGHVMIALQNRDVNHLEKFKEALSSNHPIIPHIQYNTSSITIGCREMANDLNEKGFNNNKSKSFDVEKIVASVPSQLVNHFIRGYFDGDGCVGIYKQTHSDKKMYHISILGIEDFMKFIQKSTDLSCQLKLDARTSSTYQLIARSKSEVLKLKEYLYSNANIYMNRKHGKFADIL